MPAPPSNRDLIAIFAAHLARLLNTVDGRSATGAVEINAFRLENRLERTLAGTDGRTRAVPHALLGYGLVAADRTPMEVARLWLQTVLGRRLRLARAEHRHKGHELFLALCRRGLDERWSTAGLARRQLRDDGTANAWPDGLVGIKDRLARLDRSVSQGNPAATTRGQAGPLWLEVAASFAEVAEELSIWNAITCAPVQLRLLAEGPEFNAFCSIVIKAVETANAHYGALLAVGLSPLEWGDVVGINTAKKLSAFLTAVRDGETGTGQHDLTAWQSVWPQRAVPGYDTAEELWHSELGRALRFPKVARRVYGAELEQEPDSNDADQNFQSSEAFAERLDECKAAGVIDDTDVWLLRELYEGASLSGLAGGARLRARLPDGAKSVPVYVAGLQHRLLAHARQQEAMGG